MSQNDPIEKRIIFEMTGRRIEDDDFSESQESTEEEFVDMITKLRDIWGYDETPVEGEDESVSGDDQEPFML